MPADDMMQALMMLAGAERSQTEESSNVLNRRQQDEANPCTCKVVLRGSNAFGNILGRF